MAPFMGADLARSLVAGLGAYCVAAAALARAIDGRVGNTIDSSSLPDQSAGALQRVTDDFIARGWLSRTVGGWSVGPANPPSGLAAFLEGAAAMRTAMPDDGRATTVVTMPPPPSIVGAALPATGLAHAGLVPTQEAFMRLADAATRSFTIMTPFLNDQGLAITLRLFRRTKAPRKCLIVRRSGFARAAVDRGKQEISNLNIEVLDYALAVDGGYETFHAKVLLADQDLAYVGSANMTAFARRSMELGIITDGRAARVVASIVRAVERIATRVQTAAFVQDR
jgi:hypothetical protein